MANKLKRKISSAAVSVKRRMNLRQVRHEVEHFDENLLDKHLTGTDPEDFIFRDFVLSLEEAIPYKGDCAPTEQNFKNALNQKLAKIEELIPDLTYFKCMSEASMNRRIQKIVINWYCSICNNYKADWEETRNETEFISADSYARCVDNNKRYVGSWTPEKFAYDDKSGQVLRAILPNILGDYLYKADKKYARNFVFSTMKTTPKDYFEGKLKFEKGFAKKVLADLKQFVKDRKQLLTIRYKQFDNEREIIEEDNLSVQFSDSDMSDSELADNTGRNTLSNPDDCIDQDLKHFFIVHHQFRNNANKTCCRWVFNVLTHDKYSRRKFLEQVDAGITFYDYPKFAAQVYYPKAHYMGTLDKSVRSVMDRAFKTHNKRVTVEETQGWATSYSKSFNFSDIKTFPESSATGSKSTRK